MRGASFKILDALWRRKWTLVLSQTVLTEYEEILHRDAATLGLTSEQINRLLAALCAVAERRHLSGA
jgi:predicted nucleic acid-binding protein